MTLQRFFLFTLGLGFLTACQPDIPELGLSFAEPAWDGTTLPAQHQCLKHGGGKGAPAWQVSQLPEGATWLVFAYSDAEYHPNTHGVIAYPVSLLREGLVPSVPAQTFELPEGFVSLQPHALEQWSQPGAYLGPCSGGNGHRYYVTVTAVQIETQGLTGNAFTEQFMKQVKKNPKAQIEMTLAVY